MKLSGATWCILGGAGFLGSSFIDQVLKMNPRNVICVDDFSRGRIDNLKTHLNDQRLSIANHNLLRAPYHSRVLRTANLIIVNFAARVGNIQCNMADHFGMMHTNLSLMVSFAEMVKFNKPALAVQTSSACIYPRKAPVPTPEKYGDSCAPAPSSYGYAVAKWVGEQYAKTFEAPTICVRPFNMIGPRDYYDLATSHVVPALIRKTYEEDRIVIWGTGKQKRSFIDVRDVAAVIYMLCAISESSADGEPINIGTDKMISMIELAEMIRSFTMMYTKIVMNDPEKPDGVKKRAASTKRLERLIGPVVPSRAFSRTLQTMVADYHRQKRDGLIND